MNVNKKVIGHHEQSTFCKTRPAYRQGRKLTAVKGYTISNESQHLFIYGVPQINLRSELKSLCSKYGKVLNLHVVTECETEIFTECYHVQYDRIQSARIAKRLLDNKSFYGGILHVCYTPEYESLEETKQKLFQRCKDVVTRLSNYNVGKHLEYYENDKTTSQNFNFVEADLSDGDPLLPNVKRKKRDETVCEENVVCGPQMPYSVYKTRKCSLKKTDIYNEHEEKQLFMIPTQVLKYSTYKTEKKIVFRNKNIRT